MTPPATAEPFLRNTVLVCMGTQMRWWAPAAAVLALAVAAPPASAAFPGANGKLAVSPVTGNGVIVASSQTGRWRRVCDAPQTCGIRPSGARFSPNGREIVFTDAAGHLEVTTPSGACVFCLSSHPPWDLSGTSPGFSPDGKTMTYVHHGLWQVTPGTTSPRRLLKAPVTTAVWSQAHQLLVTRWGWIWTGRPTMAGVLTLRRVVRGGAPTASPTGRELAYTHGGSVFTIGLASHKITRIARGSAPAFSPSGRSLAYLNTHHQVAIRPLGRGRTRTLTRLRGRSLDWQPVTTVTRKGCEAAGGAIVAEHGAATIRAAADAKGSHIGWNGCLDALGVAFHLNGGANGNGYDLALGHAALAGNYAALQFVFTDKYMDYTDMVNVYDLRSGALIRSAAVRCGGFPCDVTKLTVNTDGFAAWHAYDTPHPPESPVGSISCPSASLCVAGDNASDLLISTDPSGGRAAWTVDPLPVPEPTTIGGVSCPTVSFCLAVDSSGRVIWSTNPAGGPSAWRVSEANVPNPITRVSCASPTLCVAIGGESVYATTDPAGTAPWHVAAITPVPDILTGVACPSTTLCVVATSTGEVLTSQDAGDPSPTWTSPAALPGSTPRNYVTDLSCPNAGFCAAADSGAVVTTTDPAGGPGTWTTQPVTNATWVSCASTSLCVALVGRDVLTSTDPTDASPSWSTTALAATPTQALLAACPTTSLCVAFAQQYAITSSDPTGGPSAWTSFLADALPCDPATPCRAEALQALDDQGLHALDTAAQGSGTVIGGPTFSGDTIRWTDGGTPRSAGLS